MIKVSFLPLPVLQTMGDIDCTDPIPGDASLAPGKSLSWPQEKEAVLLSTSVSDSYTTYPLNTLCSRPVGSGLDSYLESERSPKTSVCVSRTWLADDGYCIVVEARIMFTLAWVVRKCFSYAAAFVYFCRVHGYLLGIAGVLGVDPNPCGSHIASRGLHTFNVKL